jgi:cobalt-zinc-cadmium efflux system outer membrane protein
MNRFFKNRATALIALVFLAGCGLSAEEEQLLLDRTDGLYGYSERWKDIDSYMIKQALPKLDEKATLDTYIKFGLLNNLGLRAEFDTWRSAMYAIPEARSLPDPSLSFTSLLIPIETRTGAQLFQLGLSQIFPWFGKYELKGEIAAKRAEALWWKVQAKRLAVVKEIKKAYHDYAYHAKAVTITDKNLKLLQNVEKIVQNEVQAGKDQSHLLRIQIEIGKIENDLKTFTNIRLSLSARLSSTLNQKNENLLPWPKTKAAKKVEIKSKIMKGLLHINNPNLLVLFEKINMKIKNSDLAQKKGYPDVKLGAKGFSTEKSKMAVKDSGKDPFAVGLSFNLPIDREKYDAIEKGAQAELRAVYAEWGQLKNDLDAKLEMLLFKLDDSFRQTSLYKDTLIPRARQSYEVSLVSYRAGKISILDLIDSERSLLKFELSYWKANSAYEKSLADLEAICGGSLNEK